MIPKSAEEILNDHIGLYSVKYPDYIKEAVIKAMHAFAAQSQCGIWVKASERLPELTGKLYIIDNRKNSGRVYQWTSLECKAMAEYQDFLWLDEQSPCICEQYREYLDEIIRLKKSASSTQELFPLLQYINKIDEALNLQP